jgi:hypothetical protein
MDASNTVRGTRQAGTRVRWEAVLGGLLLAQAAILLAMGRLPLCECGYVKLWHGVVHSAENSQHISDWYTFSHVIHGFLFYWGLSVAAPRWRAGWRAALALGIEVAWEVVENTPFVIDRYRAATISLDYYGDTILNSVCDSIACLAGFAAARRLPVAVTLLLAVAFELLTLYWIRDNLTLNVIMLVWPLDAIRAWQAGG